MESPCRAALDDEQRANPRPWSRPARILIRACVLLKADCGEGGPGWADGAIAGTPNLHRATVRCLSSWCVEDDVATLERRQPDRVYERALHGRQEARLLAPICSGSPEDQTLWRLRRPAAELAQLGGGETMPRTLKSDLKPWLNEPWWSAPTAAPAFVCRMEAVLDTYERPLDPARPIVCLDETNRQRLGEACDPLPLTPGRPTRHDPEHVHSGVAGSFLIVEPLPAMAGRVGDRAAHPDRLRPLR